MSQQFTKTIEEKFGPTMEEEPSQKSSTHLRPTSSTEKTSQIHLPPVSDARSKVMIQTPRTQILSETLGLSNSFVIDESPLKASTAKGQKRKSDKKADRKKRECMERLTQRVEGIVSSAMRRKLLSVDVSHLAIPVPGKQMWGKGVTVMGMDSRPTTVT